MRLLLHSGSLVAETSDRASTSLQQANNCTAPSFMSEHAKCICAHSIFCEQARSKLTLRTLQLSRTPVEPEQCKRKRINKSLRERERERDEQSKIKAKQNAEIGIRRE